MTVKFFIASAILAFSSFASAQSSTDTVVDTTAGANNMGVGGGSIHDQSKATNNNYVMPQAINAPMMPISNGCVLTKFTGGGAFWNLFSAAVSTQELAEGCRVQQAVELGNKFGQHKTALQIYNAYVAKQFGITPDAIPDTVINRFIEK